MLIQAMIVGVLRERKVHEYRVALTPEAVGALRSSGHRVLIERGAGAGCSIPDADFASSGAEIADTAEELFKSSDLIVKVKELQSSEFSLLREGKTLFSYLHLAASPDFTSALIRSGIRAVAFETVELSDGSLPLLLPMSRIAGRLSIQAGAHYLEKPQGGKGVLLAGSPGVKPAKVLIVGGGAVGYNAALSALGLGAEVVVVDKSIRRLDFFYEQFAGRVKTLPSYPDVIGAEMTKADLAIGAVLVTGAKAPRVITRGMISQMESGSVFADVAIDQGGCSETSRPTDLSSPVYDVDGVIHYCVTNIPSLAAKTASYALSNSILPYVLKIAEGAWDDKPLAKGINVDRGRLLINLGGDS
ncbi:MAG: alanine dehydrogenase [Deltaproteobacteria bacterium]